jgi:hypothetical protein
MLNNFELNVDKCLKRESKGLKYEVYSKMKPHLYPHSEFISLSKFVINKEYIINKLNFKHNKPIATLKGVKSCSAIDIYLQIPVLFFSSYYI